MGEEQANPRKVTSSERNSHRRSPFTLGHHLLTDRWIESYRKKNDVRMLNDNDTQQDSKVGRV